MPTNIVLAPWDMSIPMVPGVIPVHALSDMSTLTVPAVTVIAVPTEVALTANAITPSNGMSFIRAVSSTNRMSVRSMPLRVRSVGAPVPVRA